MPDDSAELGDDAGYSDLSDIELKCEPKGENDATDDDMPSLGEPDGGYGVVNVKEIGYPLQDDVDEEVVFLPAPLFAHVVDTKIESAAFHSDGVNSVGASKDNTSSPCDASMFSGRSSRRTSRRLVPKLSDSIRGQLTWWVSFLLAAMQPQLERIGACEPVSVVSPCCGNWPDYYVFRVRVIGISFIVWVIAYVQTVCR